MSRTDTRGSDAVRSAYERTPYHSHPLPAAHPDTLATMAVLHGLEPAPVENCRLLEIGCADAGHLISLAVDLPGSSFLGLDLSPSHIAAGRQMATACGLTNIELRDMDLMDVDDDLGRFDYITAHGVYSWVGPETREKILSICSRNLARGGVAYVSYNTLPGWHFRRALRDTMIFVSRDEDDPEERIARGVDWIELLAGYSEGLSGAFAQFLRESKVQLVDRTHSLDYLIHEYLEDDNEPCYFLDFMRAAARHGLGYLGDTEAETMEIGNLPPPVVERISRSASGRLETEQFIDFVRNRQFRQSLLVHEGPTLDRSLDRSLDLGRMRRFHIGTSARRVQESAGPGAGRFETAGGREFSVGHPIALATLSTLCRRAAPLPFDELLAQVEASVGPQPELETIVADIVLTSFFGNVVDLQLRRPRFSVDVPEKPEATVLSRTQAAAGPFVSNLRQQTIQMDDEVARTLLGRLDGSRTAADLAASLRRDVVAGRLRLEDQGKPLSDSALREATAKLVEASLRQMADFGLLRVADVR